jgi:hypothetical protein
MGEDLGVELAESVGFALGELVPRGENPNLVDQFVIRFSITLSVR